MRRILLSLVMISLIACAHETSAPAQPLMIEQTETRTYILPSTPTQPAPQAAEDRAWYEYALAPLLLTGVVVGALAAADHQGDLVESCDTFASGHTTTQQCRHY